MAVAYQYCTGRVDLYIAHGKSDWAYGGSARRGYKFDIASPSDAKYLGSCEQYPMVKNGENWSPWFADSAGSMEPLDWFFQNEFKIIVAPLNKVVGSVLDSIYFKSIGGYTTANPRPIGGMLQANGLYFSLWLRFDNYFNGAKEAGAVPADMPCGEFYPCVRNIEKSLGPVGTITRKNTLMVRTCPLYRKSDNTSLVWTTEEKYFTGLPTPDGLEGAPQFRANASSNFFQSNLKSSFSGNFISTLVGG